MNDKAFVLYDGRACVDVDAAIVLCAAGSEQEARADSEEFRDYDAVWFEYDLIDGIAMNERIREDIGKGVLLDVAEARGG